MGVPTANLPKLQFALVLMDVRTVVYVGWALVKGSDGLGQNIVHQSVVNVGRAPWWAA